MEQVTVIGAGPYGLSIGAHLAATGQRIRVLGAPMDTWRSGMPKGMHLKSEGFASSLYDPKGEFPLSRFCAERGIPYADIGLPTALETFSEYGQEFARRQVPMLEDRKVVAVRAIRGGFEVETADGETFTSRRVVSAIGIRDYAYTPEVLQALPANLLSHSSEHHDLSRFAGQRVAVIGGGASAADCAALLSAGGTETSLLTRRSHLGFHTPPRTRNLRDRIRRPFTAIGPGWKSVLCVEGPLVFHAMPGGFRAKVTHRHLGPAPGWFVRDQVENHVTSYTSASITGVEADVGARQATIHFEHVDKDGQHTAQKLEVDHVLSATGYHVDLARLGFLDASLRARLRLEHGAPALSRSFESSVPGLFFTGPTAAYSFGPLLRFACGAQFAARTLSRRLA